MTGSRGKYKTQMDKKTTIKDIAREAGVSPALVSFALSNNRADDGKRKYKVSDKTERHILEVAKKMNFSPSDVARSLRSKKSHTIGVVLSDISNPFFSNIARCIENEAFRRGYSVIFGSTDENPVKFDRIVRTFIDKRVDGLIIVPCEGCMATMSYVSELKIPTILIDRDIEEIEASRVMLDNQKASEMAVAHLYKLGYRKIAMVSYDMKLSNIRLREEGFRAAMEKYGIEENGAEIHYVSYTDIRESSQRIVDEIDFNSVEAIVYATNSLAIEGLKALKKKMGEDITDNIGIVAFDGSDAFDLCPSHISYIKQPISDFAGKSLELIIHMLENGESIEESILLTPEFVE